jgi:flavodoxin
VPFVDLVCADDATGIEEKVEPWLHAVIGFAVENYSASAPALPVPVVVVMGAGQGSADSVTVSSAAGAALVVASGSATAAATAAAAPTAAPTATTAAAIAAREVVVPKPAAAPATVAANASVVVAATPPSSGTRTSASNVTGVESVPLMPVACGLPVRVLVAYGSQTGCAQSIATRLGDELRVRVGAETVHVSELNEWHNKLEQLAIVSHVVVVCSTTGAGDFPDNAGRFYRAVRNRAVKKDLLLGVAFTVLALGDTNYDLFCQAGKRLHKRFKVRGQGRAQSWL